MVHGPQAGLAIVDALANAGDLKGYHLLHAARADLLRRLGSLADAAMSYREALALATNESERRYLDRRLKEVSESPRRRRDAEENKVKTRERGAGRER
jgi:RNA polymerase sigma-70 factor (ECF subfamily)